MLEGTKKSWYEEVVYIIVGVCNESCEYGVVVSIDRDLTATSTISMAKVMLCYCYCSSIHKILIV